MSKKPEWKLVKELHPAHGVNFSYDGMEVVAYIDGYPKIGEEGVVVSLLARPIEGWRNPSFDWQDVLTGTKSAVTAYLKVSCKAHFVKGRVSVSLGG